MLGLSYRHCQAHNSFSFQSYTEPISELGFPKGPSWRNNTRRNNCACRVFIVVILKATPWNWCSLLLTHWKTAAFFGVFFFFFFRLVNVWRRSPLFWRPERLIGDCLSPPPVREREKERIHRSAPIVQQALHPASHCFYLVSQAGANPCCHGIPHTLVMALQPFCLMISWLIAYLSAWLVLSRCKDIWIL